MQLARSRHGSWENAGCLCFLHFLGIVAGQIAPAPAGPFAPAASAPAGLNTLEPPADPYASAPAVASTTLPSYDETPTEAAAQITQSQLPTCSCACCQVTKVLPYNFVKQAAGGVVTSSCGKPLDPPDSAGDGQSSVCPATCQSRSRMFTAPGAPRTMKSMDYDRYCFYVCRPLADAAGSRCVPFEKSMYESAAIEGQGNGIVKNVVPVAGLDSAFDQQMALRDPGAALTVDGPAPAGAPASAGGGGSTGGTGGAGPQKAPANKQAAAAKLVFDERKLIAERLRAEAGASVSAAAAAAERIRFNRMQAKLAAKSSGQLMVNAKKVSDALSEAGTAVVTAKEKAAEGESIAKKTLSKGKSASLYQEILKRTKKLADDAIEKVVTPRMLALEETKAHKKHLDMPDKWRNVIAARAAHPYQKAEVVSVQRVDEYLREANKVHWQAVALQNQAHSLIPHANQMEAAGDNVGAVIQKKQASNLLARARSMQKTAQGYWNKAKDTQALIGKWAAGARQAAAHAAWLYDNEAVMSGVIKR